MEEIQDVKEEKIVELTVEPFKEEKIEEKDSSERVELTQAEIEEGSATLAKEIADMINEKITSYGKPFPLSFILNGLMNVYVGVLINSVPRDQYMGIIDEHFSKVIKDLESKLKETS